MYMLSVIQLINYHFPKDLLNCIFVYKQLELLQDQEILFDDLEVRELYNLKMQKLVPEKIVRSKC